MIRLFKIIIIYLVSGRNFAINPLPIHIVRIFLLNYLISTLLILEYNKSIAFCFTSHLISEYAIVFNCSKFDEICIKGFLCHVTNSAYKQLSSFYVFSWIFLFCRSIVLWPRTTSIGGFLFCTTILTWLPTLLSSHWLLRLLILLIWIILLLLLTIWIVLLTIPILSRLLILALTWLLILARLLLLTILIILLLLLLLTTILL